MPFGVCGSISKFYCMRRILTFFLFLCIFAVERVCALNIDSLLVVATVDEARFVDGHLRATFFAQETKFVDYALSDANGVIVASGQLTVLRHSANCTIDIDVKNVCKWSDELPTLYTLVLKASSYKTHEQIEIKRRVGFRTIAIRYGKLYLNGLESSVRGINIGMFPNNISDNHMLQIIAHIKQMGLNTICSQMVDERWLKLCDEYGIYYCADVSTQRKAYQGQLDLNVMNFASHTCLIMWNIGSAPEGNIQAGAFAKALRTLPDIRPVIWTGLAAASTNTDIYCPDSISPKIADAFCNSGYPLHEKPLILGKLARAGGNGYGGVGEWMKIIAKYKRFCGFFLNDGVLNDIENGPAPGINELKYVLQRVRIMSQAPRVGRLLICNDNSYTSLSDACVHWFVRNNGQIVDQGTCAVPKVKANGAVGVNLKLSDLKKIYSDGEISLDVFCRLNKAHGLLPKGYEIARTQFIIRDFDSADNDVTVLPAPKSNLKIKKNKTFINVANSLCEVIFNAQSGFMCHYNVGGENFIDDKSSLIPNFWRLPTDNDVATGSSNNHDVWHHPNMQLQNITTSKVVNSTTGRKDVCVKASYLLTDTQMTLTMSYVISETGTILVEQQAQFNPTSSKTLSMPRFGMAVTLSGTLTHAKYFGRGPSENYADRKMSQFVGVYSSAVDNMGWHYARQQENGSRSDLRWIILTNANGCGLKVASKHLFAASALHENSDGLPIRGVRLCLDSSQMGVGDYVDTSVFSECFDDTRVMANNMNFSFWLCPFTQEK